MKVLAVADKVVPELLDTIKAPSSFQNIDLILGCGDLPPEYLQKLMHLFGAPLYYVLGNHDLRHAQSPPVGCTLLHGQLIQLGNLRITGFSGSRWYNGGKYQYTEKEMAKTVSKMRFSLWKNDGLDLVVTHAPPRYIGDAEDPCHRGFRVFRKFIKKYKPRYFIHGHIHTNFEQPEERITLFEQTQVINSYGYHIFQI